MTDVTRDKGALVGAIRPGPAGEPPLFRIIHHEWDLTDAGPSVRPCDHSRFILDPKFSTVTCGKCHTQVAPFDAFLIIANDWERVREHRRAAEAAERQLHVTELRRLVRLRSMTDAERAELGTLLRSESRLSATDAAQLVSRFRKIESTRRTQRRITRRATDG